MGACQGVSRGSRRRLLAALQPRCSSVSPRGKARSAAMAASGRKREDAGEAPLPVRGLSGAVAAAAISLRSGVWVGEAWPLARDSAAGSSVSVAALEGMPKRLGAHSGESGEVSSTHARVIVQPSA